MKRLLHHIYKIFLLIWFCAITIQAHAIEETTMPLKPKRYIYPISIQLQNTHIDSLRKQTNFPVWIPGISSDLLCMNPILLDTFCTYPKFGLSTYFHKKYKVYSNQEFINVKPFWALSAYIELDRFYNEADRYTSLKRIKHLYTNNFGNRLSIGCLSDHNGHSLIFTQELLWFMRFNAHLENIFSIGLTLKTLLPPNNSTQKNSTHNQFIANKYLYLAQSIRFTLNKTAHLEHIRQLMLHKTYQYLKTSRVDLSFMVNSKYNTCEKKYGFPIIVRTLYSIPLDYYMGWICSLELGHGMQKQISFNKNMIFYKDALSINFLTGIEFRYNQLLLQYQIGLPGYDYLHTNLKIILSTDLQINISKRFFIGINLRGKELPGFRIGLSL